MTPTVPIPGMSANPMSYLHTYSPGADPVTRLGWGLGIISIAVVVIISGLLLAAILRRREPATAENTDPLHIGREGRGIAAGIRADGTGVIRVVRTAGVAAVIAAVTPGLRVEESSFSKNQSRQDIS